MKLVLFITILLVKTVLSKKAIWNGKNADVNKFKYYIYSNYSEWDPINEVKLGNGRHYLEDEIDVLPYVTLVNVEIFPIEVSKYVENGKGIIIQYYRSGIFQKFYRPPPFDSINDFNHGTCSITYCSLGLYLYIDSDRRIDDIVEGKLTVFENVFYVKLIMKTGEYLIGTFKGAGYNVHLILCPYDNWVSPKSVVKFIPYERGGIEVNNSWNLHILLPTYGYGKDANEGKLLCGHLKYLDGDKLKIGFKLDFLKSKEDIKIRKINVRSDELVCSDGMKETHYYHIGYSDKSKEITSNRYINMKYLDRKALFHEEKIYLYNKLENELRNLLNDYPNIYETNDEYVYPSIEPSCKLEINPIPGKLILHGSDNNRIDLNNSSSGVEILYMEEDLLEERTKLKCVIETEDEESKYDLKNFYNNTFKAELVSIDEEGNVKTVSQINFGESYGKYGCILKPRSGDKLHEDSKFIKPLYFETRYNEDSDSKQEWKNVNEMSIECMKKLKTKLIDMKVMINGKYIYKMSIEENKTFFLDKKNYVKFKHYDIKEIKNGIKKVRYECFYKSKNNVEFSIKYDGTILDKTVVENDKKEGSSQYDNDIKNSFQYGGNKKKSFGYVTLLISIITTIGVSTLFIAVVIFVVLRRRKSKSYEVVLHKDRKDKSSKGRSTSSSFKNPSSSSGDSKYLSKLKESRKIRKY